MKLISVYLGENEAYNNNFAITKDDYDNDTVKNESIKQQIRVGKYLEPSLTVNTETNGMKFYTFSDDGHIVINRKNLSLQMVKNSNNDTNDYSHNHLAYVTVDTNAYKIVKVINNPEITDIVGTYRGKNMLGSVINIDTTGLYAPSGDATSFYGQFVKNEFVLLTVILYHAATEKVMSATIVVKRDLSDGEVVYQEISNGPVFDDAMSLKESGYWRKFNISNSTVPRTQIYICNNADNEKLSAALDGYDDITIISVNPGDLDVNEEGKFKDNTVGVITENVVKNKHRAITVCNVKLPKEFFTEFNIRTCFSHDLKTGIIKCVRS